MIDRSAGSQNDPGTEEVPVPRYEDEDAESLGEKLAELYSRRDQNPRAKIDDVIESTRRSLRRGPRLRAGEFLKDGQYRLIERSGDSAGGATWKAWDREAQRMVVIKEMVGPWVAKRMRVGTFLEAARTLQTIDHAGLVAIYEATQSRDGFVYLATAYLDGGRFDAFEGDSIDLLQSVVEVGNALQAAHDAGLVHARVRPGSIFFDDRGGARITDFDLAGEHVHGDSASVFVAPEMVERGTEATPSADIYSLAMCTLYGLNDCRLPYTVVRGPERFIDKLDIAESVKGVLKKAVDWDLDNRYVKMADMVQDLLADDVLLAQLAERAWSKQRYVIASEHYTALWSLRPDDSVEIKHILGQIYLKMSAWEEAYTCLSTALEETTQPDPLYQHLRDYAAGTGDWKRVADLLWNQARNRPPVARASMRAELARITEEHLDDPRGASEVWTLVVQDHRTPTRGEEALQALKRLAEQREDWSAFVEHSQELLPYLDAEHQPEIQYAMGRAFIQQLDDEDTGLLWLDRAEAAGVKPLDMAGQLQEIRARRGQWRRLIGLMRLEADHEKKVHQASRILLRGATIARAVHLDAEAEAIYENMLERAPQHYPALRELARMRHRSGRSESAMAAYKQLTEHYDGKSEEPEASERAADHTAYAVLLMNDGQIDAAILNLESALRLQSDNIEALKLAGPLYLDTGRLEEGALSLERLYALFKAVHTDGSRLDAALQRADAAWFRGRLTVAMRWYNSVLSTVPDHERAWWGLAKVAMAARGGHPGMDRAPWLTATPAVFTGHEALARLFTGLFGPDALNEWLQRHPLGQGVATAGATGARSACAVVDLMDRYALINDALFERLREAFPDWQPRVDAVELLFKGDTHFKVERAYRWSRTTIDADFDPGFQRTVLSADPGVRGRLLTDLDAEECWRVLLSGQQPEEPLPDPPRATLNDNDSESLMAVEFLLNNRADYTFGATTAQALVGADAACDWVVAELEPKHARLRRIGPAIYLEVLGDAGLSVDGEEVPGWRLLGGETIQLGSAMWEVRCREDDQSNPVPLDEDSLSLDDDDNEVTLVNLPLMSAEELQEAIAREESEALPEESELSEEEPELPEEEPFLPPMDGDSVPEPVSLVPDENAPMIDLGEFEVDEWPEVDEPTPYQVPEPIKAKEVLAPTEEMGRVEVSPGGVGFDDEATVSIRVEEEAERPSQGEDSDADDFFDVADIVDKTSGMPETSKAKVGVSAVKLGASLEFFEPEEDPDEAHLDSLGPAGDAPTPQWLTMDAAEPELVATHVDNGATLLPEAVPVDLLSPSGGMLEVMSGPARGTVVPVDGVLALGRSETCEVHLPADPMLSDVHCRFVASDAGFLIMDNGSDRGTMVDGSRISEATLKGGETIMVGSTVLRFVLRG